MEDLITAREAADLLRVALQTLAHWRWLRSKAATDEDRRRFGPPYYKAGSKVLYRRGECLEWLGVGRAEAVGAA